MHNRGSTHDHKYLILSILLVIAFVILSLNPPETPTGLTTRTKGITSPQNSWVDCQEQEWPASCIALSDNEQRSLCQKCQELK